MAQDWDIKPRSEACSKCETPFADRQIYYSALVFGQLGYVRADYCGACWEPIEKAGAPYSTWKGMYRMPPPKPEDPLKKETAEALLRRLIEADDRANVNVAYILAVMLERKRILVERDVHVRDDGAMIRVYEHRQTGETFLIRDPRLGLDQIETVQQEVVAMLGGGAEAAAKTAEGEPTDGADVSIPAEVSTPAQ